jgi:hypothetical protein
MVISEQLKNGGRVNSVGTDVNREREWRMSNRSPSAWPPVRLPTQAGEEGATPPRFLKAQYNSDVKCRRHRSDRTRICLSHF